MTQVGTGNHTYELIRDFLKLPDGQSFGLVSRVATDSQDRVYVFQRKDPPVVVFDREGKYLGAWGGGEVTDPHGLKIVDDVALAEFQQGLAVQRERLRDRAGTIGGVDGVDSHGDIYAGSTQDRSVDKFVRTG